MQIRSLQREDRLCRKDRFDCQDDNRVVFVSGEGLGGKKKTSIKIIDSTQYKVYGTNFYNTKLVTASAGPGTCVWLSA